MKELNSKQLAQVDGGWLPVVIAVIEGAAAIGTLIYLAGAAHGHADCEAQCSNGGGN